MLNLAITLLNGKMNAETSKSSSLEIQLNQTGTQTNNNKHLYNLPHSNSIIKIH
jgi:hypothetical protein